MFNEEKGLNEYCGIFGIYGNEKASDFVYTGLHALQHRGQQGAGIVSDMGNHLVRRRGLGLLSAVFSKYEDIAQLQGENAIGHVRYGTSGSDSIFNIQPFLFDFNGNDVALAHNGNLTNAQTLKRKLKEDGAKFESDSDSEVLIHLIKQKQNMSFIDALKKSLNEIKGGFAFLFLKKDCMIAALDPNGFRPLCIGKRTDGSYVVASETCALDAVDAEYVRDVQPGELIIFDKDGMHLDHFTTDTQLAVCSMEYIYFANQDSSIHGVSVYDARKKMGQLLAREQPADADIVIGVPNSSLAAALGYAQESKLPYEMGLVKNQYVARTFIEPTQEQRERSVRLKLSAVKSVVQGKRVVIVDDSIVRGTTSSQIVKLLRKAGAKEIHLRIASPPFKFPCFYGIDISTRSELIAANYSIEEMKKIIDVDSLGYLSIESLVKSIPIPDAKGAPNGGLTIAYFNGEYPTPLYDYEKDYLESLKKQKRKGLENGSI
ncbi:amidophosphoribosyltransferase [Ligilactobacillus cholophilus]|uniref:amidophosphoribosyltransferase n=1 Tax=Ligilactobacillus cholophilus TaxID=3050131 RepID=UPI0025B1E36F|nr:amidophosphoribosyltransferase [Ligilactobacillus cholophilus]